MRQLKRIFCPFIDEKWTNTSILFDLLIYRVLILVEYRYVFPMIEYLIGLFITNTHMAFCNWLLEINGKLSTLRMLATTKLRYKINSSFYLKVLVIALLVILCLMELIFRKVSWELALPVFIGIEVIFWLALINFGAWIFSCGCQIFQFALFRVLAMRIFTFLMFRFYNRRFPNEKCFVFSVYFVSWIYCAIFCNFFSKWSSGNWFCQREPDFTFFAGSISFNTLHSCLN